MNKRNGSWVDDMGACVACDGEIPHGHMNNCDIHKMQTQIRIMRQALEKIRDEDYRGNRHSSHFIALWALKETE